MKPKKTDEIRRPYDVDKLSSSSEQQQQYIIKVQNKFDALGTPPDDIAGQWESLCSVIRESAAKVVGPRSGGQPCDLGYPRTSTLSSKCQQSVNKTTLSDADFAAYSRPERKLTETTIFPVLQMKWKTTFSTTT